MVCVALKGRTRMANRNKARMNRYLAGLYHWDSTLGCTKNLWGTLSPERRKKKTRKNETNLVCATVCQCDTVCLHTNKQINILLPRSAVGL